MAVKSRNSLGNIAYTIVHATLVEILKHRDVAGESGGF